MTLREVVKRSLLSETVSKELASSRFRFFFPDIQPSRIAKELDNLVAAGEHFRISITDTRAMQLIFRDVSGEADITVSVTLPHGYPNKVPIVTADPIDQPCPHCWPDGSLCIYGAMENLESGQTQCRARAEVEPTLAHQLHGMAESRPMANSGRILIWTTSSLHAFPGYLIFEAFANARVLIAGCGSGGGLVALQLVMSGVKQFTLIDNEALEAENVIRHVCGLRYLGQRKTDALSDVLEDRNPNVDVLKTK